MYNKLIVVSEFLPDDATLSGVNKQLVPKPLKALQ